MEVERIIQALERIVELLALIEKNQQVYVPSNEPAPLLDNQDVMQMLHISEATLRRRRSDGTLKCFRIRGKYYYRQSDINDMLY